MATQQEVIKSFMASLDTTTLKGAAALDAAIKAVAGNKYSSAQAVIADMKKDIEAINDADKFLHEKCGIVLDNDDTGAITGSDASGSVIKTAESIVPESGALKNFTGNQFTLSKYGITFYLSDIESDGRVKQNIVNGVELPNKSFNTLTDEQIYIWQGLYTWWANNALDLITESYGSNFGFASSSLVLPKRIYFGFYDRDDSSLAESGSLAFSDSTKKETTALVFRVNTNKFTGVDTSDPNGVNSNGEYLDRTLAHELTHCVMAANINYYNALPQFIKEGMAELTHGADDGVSNKLYMRALANPSALTSTVSNSSVFDTALNLNDTLSSNAWAYNGGYMFLRYLAKQVAEQSATRGVSLINGKSNTSLVGTSYNDTLNNTIYTNNVAPANVTILGYAGADNITNYGASAYVDGGAGVDTIYNGGYYSTILGGAGNDSISVSSFGSYSTINGGTGNDTITNGGASVLFTYASGDGNDVITGFNATSTLQIGGGKGTYSTATSGNNIIVTVGTNKVTLTGAVSLSAVNIDGATISSKYVPLTEGDDNYTNSVEGATIAALGGNDTVNNSGAKVSISGGAGNDSLYSNASLVTMSGDSGNDTLGLSSSGSKISLNGGDGNDYFYNHGTNITISGGADSDTVYNSSLASGVYIDGGAGDDSVNNQGSNVTISGGAGNDTLYSDKRGGSDKVTIDAGTGADRIINFSTNTTINGGDGNDTIGNYAKGYNSNNELVIEDGGKNVTITGGKGDDSIINNGGTNVLFTYASGDGNDVITGFNATSTLKLGNGSQEYSKTTDNGNLIVSVGTGNITLTGAASLTAPNILGTEINPLDIVGTDKAEKITNSAAGATIQALGGNDTVKNTGASVSINGGAGVDSINNSGTKVTILGDAGNDKIINSGSSARIDAGAGNDSVKNTAASVSIVGGAGKDSITNTKTKVTIDAGTSNDRIVNSAASVSIFAGTGNDLVSLGANAKNNFITYTAGNDTIKGFNATSTLKIGDGSDTYSKNTSDDDLILTVGNYSVTLTGAADLTNPNILGTLATNDLTLTDSDAAKHTLASGVEVADASERSEAVRIVGNSLANTILGGAGKDTIYGKDGDDYLEGDAGNDYLSGQNGDDTLWGGAGNDTLTGGAGSDTFIFVKGEGKDVIADFGDDDLLQIIGTWTAAYSSSTNAIAFKVGSTAGALTLKDVAATTFNINNKTYHISGSKLVK